MKAFINQVERQFDTKVKIVKSNNGAKFIIHQFFIETGITRQITCVETLQKNGIVERKHQQLLNVTRALLFQSHLLPLFWLYALLHALLLINCLPTPFLNNVSPHEKLHNTPFDISTLCVFGCLCYSSTLVAQRKNLTMILQNHYFPILIFPLHPP